MKQKKKFVIMIVDDEEPLRRLLAKALGHFLQAECVEAGNGAEALAMYKTKRVDLVITDYDMPGTSASLGTGMNGMELMRRLLEYDPRACVIIASGRDDKELRHKAISTGARKFINKPFNIPGLVNDLKQVWQKHYGNREEKQ